MVVVPITIYHANSIIDNCSTTVNGSLLAGYK